MVRRQAPRTISRLHPQLAFRLEQALDTCRAIPPAQVSGEEGVIELPPPTVALRGECCFPDRAVCVRKAFSEPPPFASNARELRDPVEVAIQGVKGEAVL